jgi:hypothetical protein
MRILEYKYKIRLTMMSDGAVLEYSLEDFLSNFCGFMPIEEFASCNFGLFSREKRKAIYSEVFKDGDRPQLYIVSRLLGGIPEDKAISKKTLTTIGEILKSKQITLGSKDLHEGK